jgi:regulatory protein
MNRPINKEKALEKMMRFCAYQERSRWEIEQKIRPLGINRADTEWVLAQLENERFFDDARFAAQYVRGKFNGQKWGRLKIRLGLKQKGVDAGTAEEALSQLDDEQYRETLEGLLLKKKESLPADEEPFQQKAKLFRFATSKGFEPTWVEVALKKI